MFSIKKTNNKIILLSRCSSMLSRSLHYFEVSVIDANEFRNGSCIPKHKDKYHTQYKMEILDSNILKIYYNRVNADKLQTAYRSSVQL